MITIRHPVAAAESAYLQYLTDNFIGHWAQRRRKPKFLALTQWLERRLKQSVRLRYADIVRVYAEMFGRDSVLVLVFEELVSSPDVFVRSICEFLGVDANEGIALSKNRHENPRWSEEQLRRLEGIQNSLVRRWNFRAAGRSRRRKMLGCAPGDDAWKAPAARFQIPEHHIQEIADLTQSGNRWLNEQWGLRLERFGYPL